MPAEGTQTSAVPPIPIKQSEDLQYLHSNTSRVSLNALEATITFGNVMEMPPGKFLIQDSVVMTLPHVHAKLLAITLSEIVKAYESQFGEIKLPKAFSREQYGKEIEKNMKALKEKY